MACYFQENKVQITKKDILGCIHSSLKLLFFLITYCSSPSHNPYVIDTKNMSFLICYELVKKKKKNPHPCSYFSSTQNTFFPNVYEKKILQVTLDQHRFELGGSTNIWIFFNKYMQFYMIRGCRIHGYRTADMEEQLWDLSIYGFWYVQWVLEPISHRHPRML